MHEKYAEDLKSLHRLVDLIIKDEDDRFMTKYAISLICTYKGGLFSMTEDHKGYGSCHSGCMELMESLMVKVSQILDDDTDVERFIYMFCKTFRFTVSVYLTRSKRVVTVGEDDVH